MVKQRVMVRPGRYRLVEVEPPCRHLGAATGETRACGACVNEARLRLFNCALHGQCVLGPQSTPGVACCTACPDRAPREVISVNQGAGGLGDALMGLCAISGLQRRHPGKQVLYRAHPHTLPFLGLFDCGHLELDAHDWDDGNAHPAGNPHPHDLQMNPGYREELASKGRVSRLERNCRNIGGADGPVTPELPRLRDPEGLRARGEKYAGAVLLSPFSTWAVREWPLQHWLTLERLLREEGYRVVVLDATDGRFPNRHAPLRSEKVIDASAERVAGIILAGACLVGNDSGLAHLSGILGRPTLVLMGQTTGPEVFGFYGPHMHYLGGHLDCRGCWWQAPFSAKCEPTCANLASTSPQEVLATVREMIGPAVARVAGGPSPQGETSKAHPRRLREGWFDLHCRAPLLDVGCWVDYLLPGFPCRRWDQMYGDGDCTHLAGVADATFATVYASHVLEHVDDPLTAIRNWWRVLKPGGKLLVSVPHVELYEGRLELPSRWNGDHRTFWRADAPLPSDPRHMRGLRQMIVRAIPEGLIEALRVCDEGHHYPDPHVHPRGEYSVEAVVRKPG